MDSSRLWISGYSEVVPLEGTVRCIALSLLSYQTSMIRIRDTQIMGHGQTRISSAVLCHRMGF